jgi:hypothetical protein
MVEIVSGDVGEMGNVARLMTGVLLMLLTAFAAWGLGAVAFANLLSRRVRVPVRTSRPDREFPSADE